MIHADLSQLEVSIPIRAAPQQPLSPQGSDLAKAADAYKLHDSRRKTKAFFKEG